MSQKLSKDFGFDSTIADFNIKLNEYHNYIDLIRAVGALDHLKGKTNLLSGLKVGSAQQNASRSILKCFQLSNPESIFETDIIQQSFMI